MRGRKKYQYSEVLFASIALDFVDLQTLDPNSLSCADIWVFRFTPTSRIRFRNTEARVL